MVSTEGLKLLIYLNFLRTFKKMWKVFLNGSSWQMSVGF